MLFSWPFLEPRAAIAELQALPRRLPGNLANAEYLNDVVNLLTGLAVEHLAIQTVQEFLREHAPDDRQVRIQLITAQGFFDEPLVLKRGLFQAFKERHAPLNEWENKFGEVLLSYPLPRGAERYVGTATQIARSQFALLDGKALSAVRALDRVRLPDISRAPRDALLSDQRSREKVIEMKRTLAWDLYNAFDEIAKKAPDAATKKQAEDLQRELFDKHLDVGKPPAP